jgi:hypothetical protein
LTAILRRVDDPQFLVNELMDIHSPRGGAFIREQHGYRKSIVAAIGGVLAEEFRRDDEEPDYGEPTDEEVHDLATEALNTQLRDVRETLQELDQPVQRGFDEEARETEAQARAVYDRYVASIQPPCPVCGQGPLSFQQGCSKCLFCDWSNCG